MDGFPHFEFQVVWKGDICKTLGNIRFCKKTNFTLKKLRTSTVLGEKMLMEKLLQARDGIDMDIIKKITNAFLKRVELVMSNSDGDHIDDLT